MQENDPMQRFVQLEDNLQKHAYAELVVTFNLSDLRELPWNFEECGRNPKLCEFKKDLLRVLSTDCQKD